MEGVEADSRQPRGVSTHSKIGEADSGISDSFGFGQQPAAGGGLFKGGGGAAFGAFGSPKATGFGHKPAAIGGGVDDTPAALHTNTHPHARTHPPPHIELVITTH